MPRKSSKSKSRAASAPRPVAHPLTSDHAATLVPNGDGSAREVPNVSDQGTFPTRPTK